MVDIKKLNKKLKQLFCDFEFKKCKFDFSEVF